MGTGLCLSSRNHAASSSVNGTAEANLFPKQCFAPLTSALSNTLAGVLVLLLPLLPLLTLLLLVLMCFVFFLPFLGLPLLPCLLVLLPFPFLSPSSHLFLFFLLLLMQTSATAWEW